MKVALLCSLLFCCALLTCANASGSTYYLPLNLNLCDYAGCGKQEKTGLVIDGVSSTSALDFANRKVTSDNTTVFIGDANTARMYLVNEEQTGYKLFSLLNKEITFDVWIANVTCGGNAALYMSSMPSDQFSTGGEYCDANGVNPSHWCSEMDLWEANANSTALTTHPCTGNSSSECDRGGCQINPYRAGNPNFYGHGSNYKVNTQEKMTVVTQFIAVEGNLTEIRRLYKVGNTVTPNPPGISENGVYGYDIINATSCNFRNGGLPVMGKALDAGMVLIFSFWYGSDGTMSWLDEGNYGPCASEPFKHGSVTFGNLKYGAIGTTYGAATTSSSSSATSNTTASSTSSTPSSTEPPTTAASSSTTSSSTPKPTTSTTTVATSSVPTPSPSSTTSSPSTTSSSSFPSSTSSHSPSSSTTAVVKNSASKMTQLCGVFVVSLIFMLL